MYYISTSATTKIIKKSLQNLIVSVSNFRRNDFFFFLLSFDSCLAACYNLNGCSGFLISALCCKRGALSLPVGGVDKGGCSLLVDRIFSLQCRIVWDLFNTYIICLSIYLTSLVHANMTNILWYEWHKCRGFHFFPYTGFWYVEVAFL